MPADIDTKPAEGGDAALRTTAQGELAVEGEKVMLASASGNSKDENFAVNVAAADEVSPAKSGSPKKGGMGGKSRSQLAKRDGASGTETEAELDENLHTTGGLAVEMWYWT